MFDISLIEKWLVIFLDYQYEVNKVDKVISLYLTTDSLPLVGWMDIPYTQHYNAIKRVVEGVKNLSFTSYISAPDAKLK